MSTDLVHVPLPGPLREAHFVERPNRFLLRCELRPQTAPGHPSLPGAWTPPSPGSPRSPGRAGDRDRWTANGPEVGGELVAVHMADPGRLEELLVPGRRVWIRYAASPTRKTDWSAVLVETPDGAGLVSVDTTLPNRLIHRALEAGALDELDGWTLERAEFPLGSSRIDFLLSRPISGGDGTRERAPSHPRPGTGGASNRKLALEVKSVTLVEDGVALFPDAVTARGARHVRELTDVAGRIDREQCTWEAAILFVLQRNDAHRIEAARFIDPDFADALERAKSAGVRVLGRRCRVTMDRLELGPPVPAS